MRENLVWLHRDPKDEYGFTPSYFWLYHAVKENDFERFKLIFDEIEEKNPSPNDGMSILHEAAQMGRDEIVRFMLKNLRLLEIINFFNGSLPWKKNGYFITGI